MSKHWVPEDDCVPLSTTKRGPRTPLPAGAKAGLLLVAVACAGVVLGLNQAFARADVFADEAATASALTVR